ncbi:replication initiation protein RepM, partial [Acinetobacter baumannii]
NANDPLFIHAESYINHFGVHRNTAYQALKDACKDLFARQFSYQELSPKGKVINQMSRWVSQIGYMDDGATVNLIFAPAIIPFITRLEEQFTSYELKQISGLTTAYAVRLYELLIAWRSTGKTPVIELSDFRQKLGVLETEYSRMHDFKKRVLDPAIKNVNEHTDITIKVEQHKTGRSITGFSFKFKQKQQPKIEKPIDPKRDPNTPDFFIRMTDAQRHLFGNKLAHDARVQSEYSHLIGTGSYEDFAKLLADMLAEEQHFKMFYPLLVEHGYKA